MRLPFSLPQQDSRVLRQEFDALKRGFQFAGRHEAKHFFHERRIEEGVLFPDPGAGRGERKADASRIFFAAPPRNVAAAHEAGHVDAHGREAHPHVFGESGKRGCALRVEVVENARLVRGESVSSLIGAEMLAMAGEINGRVGVE